MKTKAIEKPNFKLNNINKPEKNFRLSFLVIKKELCMITCLLTCIIIIIIIIIIITVLLPLLPSTMTVD